MAEKWGYALLIFATITVLRVQGQCPGSGSDCVQEGRFDELSQSNPTYYCQQGAIRYYEAFKCLQDCSSQDKIDFLNRKKTEIDTFCSQQFTKCPSVTDTFVKQNQCYDKYNGVDAVVSDIFRKFENREDRIDCNYLYWGRYCERTQDCQINKDLELYLVSKKPQTILALAVCGSETANDLADAIYDNDQCSTDLSARIERECNIGCEVSTAESASQICELFDRQAKCIERLSSGCRELERRYLLPRLDTYAVANKYLSCNIKANGLRVQAPAASQCDYSAMLNACFYANTIEAGINLYRLLPLFNRDLPVSEYCRYANNFQEVISNCSEKYLSCRVPQSKLYGDVDNSKDFGDKLGTFPLNVWGLNSILRWLENKCQNVVMWSEEICAPATTPAQVPSTREAGTPKPGTPKSGNSTARTPSPGTRAPAVDNGFGNLQAKDSSSKLAVSILHVFLATIMVTLSLASYYRAAQ